MASLMNKMNDDNVLSREYNIEEYKKFYEIGEKHKNGITVTKEESNYLTEYNCIYTFNSLLNYLKSIKFVIECSLSNLKV